MSVLKNLILNTNYTKCPNRTVIVVSMKIDYCSLFYCIVTQCKTTINMTLYFLSDFWLGGRDDLEEGKWQWSSTKSYFMYTDWAPHEPSGGVSGNCLQMWSASNWQWDDYACSTEIKYICESKYVSNNRYRYGLR